MTPTRAFLAAAALVSMAGCAGNPPASSTAPYTYSTPSEFSPSADVYVAQRLECQKRPSKGDIVVYETSPDLDPNGLQLGGGYFWEEDAKQCVTTAQMVLDTAPPDDCDEVARAKDNPGFDPDNPEPLRKAIARSAGC